MTDKKTTNKSVKAHFLLGPDAVVSYEDGGLRNLILCGVEFGLSISFDEDDTAADYLNKDGAFCCKITKDEFDTLNGLVGVRNAASYGGRGEYITFIDDGVVSDVVECLSAAEFEYCEDVIDGVDEYIWHMADSKKQAIGQHREKFLLWQSDRSKDVC